MCTSHIYTHARTHNLLWFSFGFSSFFRFSKVSVFLQFLFSDCLCLDFIMFEHFVSYRCWLYVFRLVYFFSRLWMDKNNNDYNVIQQIKNRKDRKKKQQQPMDNQMKKNTIRMCRTHLVHKCTMLTWWVKCLLYWFITFQFLDIRSRFFFIINLKRATFLLKNFSITYKKWETFPFFH